MSSKTPVYFFIVPYLRLFLRSPTDRIFFKTIFSKPPFSAAWSEPTVKLHQTGASEGRSTNWATALRQLTNVILSGGNSEFTELQNMFDSTLDNYLD